MELTLAGQSITADGDVMVVTVGDKVYVVAVGGDAHIQIGDQSIELEDGESAALSGTTNLTCQEVAATIEGAGGSLQTYSDCTGYGDVQFPDAPPNPDDLE